MSQFDKLLLRIYMLDKNLRFDEIKKVIMDKKIINRSISENKDSLSIQRKGTSKCGICKMTVVGEKGTQVVYTIKVLSDCELDEEIVTLKKGKSTTVNLKHKHFGDPTIESYTLSDKKGCKVTIAKDKTSFEVIGKKKGK